LPERLLILKEGAVAVVKEGVEIAEVAEPGAVFGGLSVLLDQPHTADVGGQPRRVIGKTVEKMEELLGASGANLLYAGYPYDPFAPMHRTTESRRLNSTPNDGVTDWIAPSCPVPAAKAGSRSTAARG
jgi:hypothetical protein